jgi:hypothetical protein
MLLVSFVDLCGYFLYSVWIIVFWVWCLIALCVVRVCFFLVLALLEVERLCVSPAFDALWTGDCLAIALFFLWTVIVVGFFYFFLNFYRVYFFFLSYVVWCFFLFFLFFFFFVYFSLFFCVPPFVISFVY